MAKKLYQEYFGGEIKDTKNFKNNIIINRWQYNLITGSNNSNLDLILEDNGSKNLNALESSEEQKKYFIQNLKQKGFMDNSENYLFDKKYELKQQINYPKLSGPRGAFIEITNACHLSCITCYNEFTRAQSNKVMKTEKIKNIIDELYSFGADFIALTGGETTCRKDWFDIAKYVKEKDMFLRFYTCGVYPKKIRESILENLVELSPGEIRITYAGMEMNDKVRVRKGKINGTFDEITQSAKYLIDNKQNVKLNYILSHENVSETEKFLEFAYTLNSKAPPKINIGPVRAYGNASLCHDFSFTSPSAQDFFNINNLVGHFRKEKGMDINIIFDCLDKLSDKVMLQKKEKIANTPWPMLHQGCDFGRSSLGISYDGSISVCGIMGNGLIENAVKIAEENLDELAKLGITPKNLRDNEFNNATTKSIEDLWFNSPLLALMQYFYKKEDCEPCDKYRVQCMGMCPAMSLYDSGDMRRGDKGCVRKLL
ncbi:MAG: radical SAM protein [Candidatus Nanoarchaeia archaeon]|nr:radical SAM protein [Candidatus Nanoarchaeia archaeon]